MIHRRTVEVPIYGGYLRVYLTDEVDVIQKELGYDLEGRELYAHCVHHDYKGWNGYAVVFNPNNQHSKINYGVIAHEALHVLSHILLISGAKFDPYNDEPMAYLIDWIVDEIHKSLDKFGYSIHP